MFKRSTQKNQPLSKPQKHLTPNKPHGQFGPTVPQVQRHKPEPNTLPPYKPASNYSYTNLAELYGHKPSTLAQAKAQEEKPEQTPNPVQPLKSDSQPNISSQSSTRPEIQRKQDNRKPFSLLPSSAPLRPTHGMVIQPAFESAYVLSTAHLHPIHANKPDKVNSSQNIGPKLKAGQQIEVDEQEMKDNNTWVKAQHNQDQGYIRKTKYLRQLGTLPSQSTQQIEPENAPTRETVGELSDQLSGGFNNTFGSYLEDSNIGITGGVLDGFAGLLAMINNARNFIDEGEFWQRLELGYDFVQSTATTAASVAGIVSNTSESEGSELGANITGAISDGLSSLKDGVMTVVNFYKLYQKILKTNPQEAAKIFEQMVSAASAGAKTAQSVYGILNENVPGGLLYTVPAFSLAVSAINALVRLSDALTAGDRKTDMASKSTILRSELVKHFGEPGIPNENNIGKSYIFYTDRRGTFPNYKTYFRVKPEIRTFVKDLYHTLVPKNKAFETHFDEQENSSLPTAYDEVLQLVDQSIDDPIKQDIQTKLPSQPPATAQEFETNIVEKLGSLKQDEKFASVQTQLNNLQKEAQTKLENIPNKIIYESCTNLKDKINQGQISNQGKDNLKPNPLPKNKNELKQKVVDKIAKVRQDVKEYEFVDKMSEINQKRQTTGWTDVALELVNISGDITTIAVGATGVGVLIGQGLKVSTAGVKVAHESAKFGQKLYRDRGGGTKDKKSTQNKHREYCKHARFIYKQIASLDPKNLDQGKAQAIINQIRATGVNTTEFYSEKDATAQVKMLIDAMKKRN